MSMLSKAVPITLVVRSANVAAVCALGPFSRQLTLWGKSAKEGEISMNVLCKSFLSQSHMEDVCRCTGGAKRFFQTLMPVLLSY